jgi:hypothetical protein
MHHRTYHPRLGHFLTPDFRPPSIDDPSTFTEPYAYAAGNSGMYWDLNGLANEAMFDRMVEKKPEDPSFALKFLEADIARTRYKIAAAFAENLKRGIQNEPKVIQGLLNAARINFGQGKYEEMNKIFYLLQLLGTNTKGPYLEQIREKFGDQRIFVGGTDFETKYIGFQVPHEMNKLLDQSSTIADVGSLALGFGGLAISKTMSGLAVQLGKYSTLTGVAGFVPKYAQVARGNRSLSLTVLESMLFVGSEGLTTVAGISKSTQLGIDEVESSLFPVYRNTKKGLQ